MTKQTGGVGRRYWWKQTGPDGEDGSTAATGSYWWKTRRQPGEGEACAIRPRPGHLCPECGEGTFAYDGLFLLTCPACHYVAEGGANF